MAHIELLRRSSGISTVYLGSASVYCRVIHFSELHSPLRLTHIPQLLLRNIRFNHGPCTIASVKISLQQVEILSIRMTHIATRYVYISASDGKRVTIDPKTKRKEDNSPTKEQLTKTKGENGQWTWYQELDFKDKRHYDWRKKLGGLLIETMADNIKKRKLDLKVPGIVNSLKAIANWH